MTLVRRGFLGILSGLIAAPTIVTADNLMKINGKPFLEGTKVPDWCPPGWLPCDGRELNELAFPILAQNYKNLRFAMRLPNIENRDNQVFVVSATDFIRPNGQIMRAGAMHSIFRELV